MLSTQYLRNLDFEKVTAKTGLELGLLWRPVQHKTPSSRKINRAISGNALAQSCRSVSMSHAKRNASASFRATQVDFEDHAIAAKTKFSRNFAK